MVSYMRLTIICLCFLAYVSKFVNFCGFVQFCPHKRFWTGRLKQVLSTWTIPANPDLVKLILFIWRPKAPKYLTGDIFRISLNSSQGDNEFQGQFQPKIFCQFLEKIFQGI